MQVKLYSFSKRNNSLSIPSGEGTDVSVVLKSPSSVLKPRLELQTLNPIGYNYVYIPAYSRYYYITDSTYDRGVWSIDCDVDVLASWSSYIRATSAQVMFSSSNYNLDVIDNRIAAEGNVTRNVKTATFDGTLANQYQSSGGTFCLSVLDGNGMHSTGVATTYFMTQNQMTVFAQELLSPDGIEALKQYFNNPMESVIECYYLPINVDYYVNRITAGPIVIAGYQFPTATGRQPLVNTLVNNTRRTVIEIPWTYSDFRRLPPYTSMELFVPFCGSKPLPNDLLYQMDQFFVDYSVDVTTGNVQAIAYIKETVLQEWSGNCRITIPIGQQQARVSQALGEGSGIIMAGVGLASGNIALGAAGIATAVSNAASPAEVKKLGGFDGSILGAVLGNDMMTWQQFRCTVTSHQTASSPESIRAVIGNANTDVLSLSDLTGYCQTYGASVSAPATAEELNRINSMLDSGVYL